MTWEKRQAEESKQKAIEQKLIKQRGTKQKAAERERSDQRAGRNTAALLLALTLVCAVRSGGVTGQEIPGLVSAKEKYEAADSISEEATEGTKGIILTEETIAGIKGSEEWKQIFQNENAYPEALLKALKRNPEMLDFVSGYLEADAKASGGITPEESREQCPLFLQWDSRWGYVSYGNSNIGVSGCGPTCLSMVLYSFTGNKDLTPDVLAGQAMEQGYYIEGKGTSWDFMEKIAWQYGVLSRRLETWSQEAVNQYLEDGKLLICSMRPGDFTDTGHFIVIRGRSNGKLLVNDPFSYTNSSKEWDYDTIAEQSKQMWTFEVQDE